MSLQDLVIQSAARAPDAIAVRAPDATLTYGALDASAQRLAHALRALGLRAGDRVGIWLEKSAQAVIAMQAVLHTGAAYVPIDPLSPAVRARTLIADCAMRALVTTKARAGSVLIGELEHVVPLCVDGRLEGRHDGLSWDDVQTFPRTPLAVSRNTDDALAYILYTSGSTGRPKGVCISHRNALAFIEWAAAELGANADDRFASHAPFHFDLSVLDLYVAFHAGASVSLIPDGMSWMPSRLVEHIQREAISVWYSVPSALVLMMEQGGLLEAPSLPLRAVLFAGEPFPVKQLRRLVQRWPGRRYLNLYGPTETNVCTWHEVGDLPDERTLPVPIGRACSGDRVWARKADGAIAGPGEEGELMVSGPTVMLGYWGRPPQGNAPYATGDIVRLEPEGHYTYLGRRDQLVKVRGQRVELGEIEAALEQYPDVREAAVTLRGDGTEARLVAFLVCQPPEPSLIAVKRHCAERLPRYMIVDDVRFLEALPRTRNGKIDRLMLSGEASPPTLELPQPQPEG